MHPIDLLIAQVHTLVRGVAADQAVPLPGHPHHLAVLTIANASVNFHFLKNLVASGNVYYTIILD